jgi:hypothetical protein
VKKKPLRFTRSEHPKPMRAIVDQHFSSVQVLNFAIFTAMCAYVQTRSGTSRDNFLTQPLDSTWPIPM